MAEQGEMQKQESTGARRITVQELPTNQSDQGAGQELTDSQSQKISGGQSSSETGEGHIIIERDNPL